MPCSPVSVPIDDHLALRCAKSHLAYLPIISNYVRLTSKFPEPQRNSAPLLSGLNTVGTFRN
jgi:hypothetical protein